MYKDTTSYPFLGREPALAAGRNKGMGEVNFALVFSADKDTSLHAQKHGEGFFISLIHRTGFQYQ